MLFCPPTQAPVMASPSAGSLRALSFLRAKGASEVKGAGEGKAVLSPSQRNMAQVEKLGLLSRQASGLLSGLDLFGGWVDMLGVLTRGGWLHLFTSPEDSVPQDSICLLASARRGEAAAVARPLAGQPGAFEITKTMPGGGFLFSSQHTVRWLLRAENSRVAEEWLGIIHAHVQPSGWPTLSSVADIQTEQLTAPPAAGANGYARRRAAEQAGSPGEAEAAEPRAPRSPRPVGVVEVDDDVDA
mmetsp:Transcript_24735/g.61408  ORF Transcript_24735/g.61408 Transcript_24735/m.61408 type:complete len:243 (+) Transcript_24735:106-834(+)